MLNTGLPFVQLMAFMSCMRMIHDVGALDLDLLVALETLVAVPNVTRAAARLGITQSAMSHRLRRLRELLDDPVVVGGRAGLVPTPRAVRLAEVIARSLHEIRTAVAATDKFDPATSERAFTVVTSDFAEFDILPRVLGEISAHAPGVSVTMREPFLGVLEALERGDVDIIVGPQLPAAAGLVQRKIAEDGFASAVRDDHPLVGQRLEIETFIGLRHLVVDPQGQGQASLVDLALRKLGRQRDVAMRIPHFMGAPFIVARSDLLLTAPRSLLLHFGRLLPLRIFEPPIELPDVRTMMTWHERVSDDPAHAWLRDLTARCTAATLGYKLRRPKPGRPFEVQAEGKRSDARRRDRSPTRA